MLSKAVILIASFRKGEGDSGSSYAMQKAREYGRLRCVMYNENTDKDNKMFGLNRDCFEKESMNVLTQKSIKELI